MPLDDESANVLEIESEKLKQILNMYTKKIEEISPAEIVELYYQVINVNSLLTYCQNLNDIKVPDINAKISNTQKIIKEEFNNKLHHQISYKIDDLIKTTKSSLKEIQKISGERTKEVIEKQAKKYEDLRRMMSTKEFVEQYDELIDKV